MKVLIDLQVAELCYNVNDTLNIFHADDLLMCCWSRIMRFFRKFWPPLASVTSPKVQRRASVFGLS